ncbi:MAG: type VI secretion system tube protein Hcp [Acidobacteria bacterium]|nr:type VI secretion system tube protein Hcp [Acidobacteriota bacterium]
MAVDMFMKIGDIKGESQDGTHKEAIDVLSWSWGVSQTGTMHAGSGGGGGKANFQDLSFTKFIDKSSPNLLSYCATGEQFKEAKLIIRKAGGKNPLEYLLITMSDCIITSISTGGSGGEDRFTENVSINFAKVKIEYQPQKPDGSKDGGAIPWGWDISANKSA